MGDNSIAQSQLLKSHPPCAFNYYALPVGCTITPALALLFWLHTHITAIILAIRNTLPTTAPIMGAPDQLKVKKSNNPF